MTEASTGGPGIAGFLATFGIVLALIVLMFDMTRRLRRIDYRQRAEKKATTDLVDNEATTNIVNDDGPDDVNASSGGHTSSTKDNPPEQD